LTIFVIAYIVRPEAALSYIRNDDVIWQFAYGFVIYVAVAAAARASRTRAELKEREFAAAGAELQALRARLDPHFLFNTLHSLTQLAREDPDATEIALERFGELMRYVLNAGRGAAADVAIEDELAFVRNYLALEHLRLGERLRVIENVDADTLELAVPPLSLQPLVENAVRHGIGPRREPGTIRLDIRVAEDMLEIAVTDDGKGSDPESVRHSEGLGLQGVRRQIEARFPGRSRFDIATAPGAGFAVRMTMPALLPGR
jgi:sensor histidine kinase YesM